ncbi:crotonobetainyl-CoA:carnitine CoA-transferase [Escherichia coli]|uniref:Crotonobetainyl-CoA:carnitine CoA-transferase n=1 Tax=Escherichia coli TaxID=562 RepID=A0A376W0I7_ECOLX|nr:crotonobetainyl-CoA:carnitine CoA-transferase [Escherichia coli]
MHALSLNIFKDEGREAFLKLMETTDIFIEASKGPAFARRGITDEVLWQHNPKLVIAHLSGFGQYGTEEYTNLPAYNTIAQAFSGYLIQKVMLTSQCLPSRIPRLLFWPDCHHGGAGSTA